jgi:hypothetical protein
MWSPPGKTPGFSNRNFNRQGALSLLVLSDVLLMEQLVAELKKLIPFKDTTLVNDIVVVAAKKPQMLAYAKVGDIIRDETRKEEWWQVTLHLLSIPLQTVVWTLRTPQFTGQEIFTMGGEERFIKAVRFAEASPGPLPSVQEKGGQGKERRPGLRIVK